jgi:Arc/MetJ-type ribon-helix-helix transcriptional regulator
MISEQQTNRRKVNVCATISPYIAGKMDRLVEANKFSSISDLIGVALAGFLTKFTDPEEAML